MTLRDALVGTYQTNPTLMAQRQSLRATDEGVALARAQGRPSVSADASLNQDVVTRNIGVNQRDFSAGASVLVLTSDVYEESDYVRDWSEFTRLARG